MAAIPVNPFWWSKSAKHDVTYGWPIMICGMASFKAKFPVLQELFAKNHRGAFAPPPPAGPGLKYEIILCGDVIILYMQFSSLFSAHFLPHRHSVVPRPCRWPSPRPADTVRAAGGRSPGAGRDKHQGHRDRSRPAPPLVTVQEVLRPRPNVVGLKRRQDM